MSNPAPQQSRLNCEPLKKLIREVPDFPKKGILFYDITTLLKDKARPRHADRRAGRTLHQGRTSTWCWAWKRADLFSARRVAYRLNAGFVPLRKPGKLPAATAKFDYALEYGTNTLEIHKDAIQKGQRVLIVDDLLATGGTAEATAKLAIRWARKLPGLGFVVELDFLKGRDKLTGYDVFSLLHYQE